MEAPEHALTQEANRGDIDSQIPWYRRTYNFKPKTTPPVPSQRSTCPEVSAGWFSRLTFSWMKPLLSIERRRPLEPTDIWLVDPARSNRLLSNRFEASFHRRARDRKHPLVLALYDTFAREFWISGAWQLVASLCQVGIPLVLHLLLLFVTNRYEAADAQSRGDNTVEGPPPPWNGLGLVLGLLLLQLVQGVGVNQSSYHGFLLGTQVRSVLVVAMLKKAMKISGPLRKPHESSKDVRHVQSADEGCEDAKSVINLMSSDTGRVDQAARAVHPFWTAPITIILASAIVLYNLTYSALPGIGLLLAGIVVLQFTVKFVGKRQTTLRSFTNSRVSLTQEVLRHIRFVKYNAWELYLLKKLDKFRTKELRVIVQLLLTKDAVYAVSTCLPVFASVASLVVYAKADHQLTVSTAFSSLVIFNTLRVPLASFSVSARQISEGWTALKRLQDFLLAEEFVEDTIWDWYSSDSAVRVQKGTFIWSESAPLQQASQSQGGIPRVPFSLTNIHLSIPRGELVAVVGATGSGKTSLLRALAGQMTKTGGEVRIGARSRSVCAQTPWIQSASLKDNILFGKPLDRDLYERVVQSCALTVDIESLADGDETEIGERGISLSGGQRQRVNLARAIYADSDLILLDDPLSAVDAHVGQHLFREAICGLLKEKTRILVTHQQHTLRGCDRIIWMDGGRIRAVGTHAALVATEPEFRAMLATATTTTTQSGIKKETCGTKTSSHRETSPTSRIKGSGHGEKDDNSDKTAKKSKGLLNGFSTYAQCSGHLFDVILSIILLLLAQGTSLLTNIWLSFWVSNRFPWLTRNQYITLYILLAVAQTILLLYFAVSISVVGIQASRNILDRAIARVVGAPMSFHDTQPLGQLVNLFMQDAEVVDQQLPEALCRFLFSGAIVSSVCILLVYYFPVIAIALVPVAAGFLYVVAYYRSTERQLKGYESSFRGVMFSRFSESVLGVQTIRAYGMQARFLRGVHDAIDDMNAAVFLSAGAQRWLAVWLDLTAVTMVLTTGLLIVFGVGQANPSISGVALSSVLALRINIQLIVQQLGDLEESMNSLQQLHRHCTDLPTEPYQLVSASGLPKIPDTWPNGGNISIMNLHVYYRPELPAVLNNLNMDIPGGEKLGIVGRTGAGKSSLINALFRLLSPSQGSITVDGLDISQVPLLTLRSRISIVPQDPVLFRGTVRSSLDPFDQHTDMELWHALQAVGIKGGTGNTSNNTCAISSPSSVHLDTTVEEDGANFSQGQRQLLAIARALLQHTQIVVFDEATSCIDMETDARIQEVMNKVFSGRTLLTIAHRLQTVLRYDRICVLDQGQIMELDSPIELWGQEGGIFRSMCDEIGIKEEYFY
ncbi:P-loop containing nucleoside triphosphate hydrolase protein [Hypoxylon fragiforme]|uniref:P-loop containing nucleoside triphosphate hydrolase protein n=1 Tax=Hypoxylon fragiforme TaxID=63214 RepID=UPI0020C6040D|nr:P-loop containing nucleoside triphosphate hydrolase protein [Hypoxylon fragiforme]KAI2613941.1 P-loop containing nucleoside triphosphate hydrolase protein [Hypoxylon fragiforme]